jgi:NAD(P)H-dependent FMN reductase
VAVLPAGKPDVVEPEVGSDRRTGADEVEERLEQAREREFQNYDEAVLVLMDAGIDQYFEEPVDTFRDALDEEVAGDTPTLYDTYNAATRALTHTEGLSAEQRDRGLEQAARLLDRRGEVPDAAALGRQAVEQRVEEYTTEDDVDPYWEDEEETLETLVAAHGDATEGGSRSP